MTTLFLDLDFIKFYLDDLIHFYSYEKDYHKKLNIILNYLQSKNLKVKVSKYEFL